MSAKLVTVAVITGICALLAAAVAPPNASACSGGGATCHGVIQFFPPFNVTGGLVTLNASAMSVTDTCNDFVNHEMWVTTNNGITSGNDPFGSWVEGGLKFGTEPSLHNCGGMTTFWAEENTNALFVAHLVAPANINTNYNTKISYSGSNSWGVYFDGNSVGGTSHYQPCCSPELQVGGETTTSAAILHGTGSNLQKRGTDNTTWSYGWGGSAYYDGTSNPFSVSWLSCCTSMEVTAN